MLLYGDNEYFIHEQTVLVRDLAGLLYNALPEGLNREQRDSLLFQVMIEVEMMVIEALILKKEKH